MFLNLSFILKRQIHESKSMYHQPPPVYQYPGVQQQQQLNCNIPMMQLQPFSNGATTSSTNSDQQVFVTECAERVVTESEREKIAYSLSLPIRDQCE